MEIIKRMTENNFNEVAKLIQSNSLPQNLMTGNIKSQLKRYRLSYSTPASIQLAQKHQKTVKQGFKYPLRGRQEQLCDCCNLRVQNQDIPLCYSIQPHQQKNRIRDSRFESNQYKLTSDVALFFIFIKSAIILTLLHFLIHSLFNLYTSQMLGGYCELLDNCNKVIWNTASISNKLDRQDLIKIVDLLNLGAILLSMIFFGCNRRRQYKLSRIIDQQTQNQADYTILISNIPVLQFPRKGEAGKKLQFYYRKHLETYFENIISKWLIHKNEWEMNKDEIGIQLLQLMNANNGQLRSQQIVKSISLCYNLSRLQVLQDIKSNLIKNYENNDTDQETSLLSHQNGQAIYSGRFVSIPERVNFINDCQMVLNGQFARDNSFLFNVTHFVGHAFISFQYQHYKEYIQRKFNENPQFLNYNGNYLKVEDASHPTDVYWQNMRVTENQRRKRTLLSYIVITFILLFSFVVLLFLELWKENYSKSQKGDFINLAKSYSITASISLVILLINYGIDHISRMLTQYEKRKTRTNYTFSLLIKNFAAKLINTIMIYFFIALILSQQEASDKFMGPTGLIFQISSLILISGFISIIKSFIYPYELWLRFFRWLKYRKVEDKVENKFQITLNHQFQFPEFDMAQKYSNYLVALYTAFFYSYLVPVSIPAIFLIFLLQYWVDKYTLLRRSSLKFHFNFTLSNYATKIFECSLLALGLGNLIFSVYIHNYSISIINLCSLGITLLFSMCVWIAPKKLQAFMFGSYQFNEKYTYDDCLYDGKFQSTYWSQNPATFLIQEQKITGKKKTANSALNRQSKQGGIFLSSFKG